MCKLIVSIVYEHNQVDLMSVLFCFVLFVFSDPQTYFNPSSISKLLNSDLFMNVDYSIYEGDHEQLLTEDDPPVRVIIVTQMRSGSSFTGELFNRNRDFVYFYEPLYDLRHMISGKNSDLETYLKLPLRNLFRCDFKNMPVAWWKPKSGSSRQDCEFSLAFQESALFCYHGNKMKKYKPLSYVPDNITKLEQLCNSKKHIAIKTIRIEDLNYLKDIIEDASLNVKIIHLVRDPRAVFLSRENIADIIHQKNVSNPCPRLKRNLQFWLNTPSWLQNKYLLVRYEDLAEKPLLVASRMYKFLNINMPLSVKVWIKQNTNQNKGGKFSHTRDSRSAAMKWRTNLSFQKVQYVQSRCQSVMDLLGYNQVKTKELLTNLNFPVLLPLLNMK